MQWRSFGVRQSNLIPGMMRLQCMLWQDSEGSGHNNHRWTTFLGKERIADHGARGCTNSIVQQMGSMTHMDIAKYISHELHDRLFV